MNYIDRYDTDMHTNLQNGDMSSGIGLLNIHILPQYDESSNLDEMEMGVENVNVNGGRCYLRHFLGLSEKFCNGA